MGGGDSKLFGNRFAGDVVLIVVLQENADAFEQRLGSSGMCGGHRVLEHLSHVVYQCPGQFWKYRGSATRSLQFHHGVHNMRQWSGQRTWNGEFLRIQVRYVSTGRRYDADANLFRAKQQGHELQSGMPGRVVPTIWSGKERRAR